MRTSLLHPRSILQPLPATAALALACALATGADAPNPVWGRQLGTPLDDSATTIALDPAGRCYVAGSTSGDLAATNAGGKDVLVAAFAADGIHGMAFTAGAPGRVFVGGCQNWDQCQAFVRLFDTDGDELWSELTSAGHSTCGTQIAIDAGGNVYQAGGTHGPLFGAYDGSGSDVFVVKLAPPR